jgi:putative spermidine/putrescine transport system permease protein
VNATRLAVRTVARSKRLLIYTLLLAFVLYVLAPFLAIIVTALGSQWFGGTWLPQGWTLRWFDWALAVTNVVPILGNSLLIASISIGLAFIVGVPTAWAMAKRRLRLRPLLFALILLPRMIPPITFALGVAQEFYGLRLVNTHLGVALAHTILVLPFVVLIMSATFESLDERVLEAGAVCGANWAQNLRYVIIPMAMPGVIAATMFGFVTSYNEFTLTLMTYGPQTRTLTVQTYLSIGEGFIEVASAISVILLVPSLVILALLQRLIDPTSAVGGFKGL